MKKMTKKSKGMARGGRAAMKSKGYAKAARSNGFMFVFIDLLTFVADSH